MNHHHAQGLELVRENLDLGATLPPFVPVAPPGHENYVVTDSWKGTFPPPWPVWDRGNDLSCAAFAVAGAVRCHTLRESAPPSAPLPTTNDPAETPAAKFIFLAAKYRRGTLGQRSGVYVSDALNVVENVGVCSEAAWDALPSVYQDVPKWTPQLWEQLDPRVLKDASRVLPFGWKSLGEWDKPRDTDTLRSCLCENRPFTICVYLFRRYRAGPQEEYRLPESRTDYLLDAAKQRRSHAMLVLGYDIYHRNATANDGAFVVRDCDGPGDGVQGYFWLPFDWATDPALSYGLHALARG